MGRQIYTVAKNALIAYAERIEADAEDSLQSYILLGQTDKYSAMRAEARVLRAAAEYKNMGVRREILRDNGWEVL